ncbi:MAG TPA: hypothetical protein VEU96_07350 [Bryobacteraceae bacterium]|nr:hypothetical protein [Bryobacteraceae bacterium]
MRTTKLAHIGRFAALATALASISLAQNLPDELSQLKAQVAQQQRQIDELTRRLDRLSQPLPETNAARPTLADRPLVASTTPMIPAVAAPATALPTTPLSAQDRPAESSPLQLKVGDAYITPVGFMDFTSVYRSHAAGAGIGTNFGSIPYGTVFQNKLSEERLSMQNSRVGFRVDAMVKGAHVIGYLETDFLGNNPANVAVTSNANTFRSRLYWVDISKNSWEVMAGQSWSLMTPNRTGISPLPGNIFFSQNIDVNYQAGLTWGRIPELRFVYRPSDKVALAVAFDNQEQYVGGSGGGGTPNFPSNLAATYPGGQLNNGNTTLNAPQAFPDTILKLAFDPSKKAHFEIGGVLREFRVWNPNNNNHYTTAGGGGFLNFNFELLPGFRVLTNNYWSDGGGRYIFGLAPDLVARADGSLSLVHSGSTVTGFEFTHKNTLLYGYYGGVYIGKNVIIDTTAAKPALVGYGFTGSGNGQNRAIQEITFGFNQTLWKDAKYGALNFMGQYSYLARNPWFIATGQPEDAHLNMLFFNLRYTLPGSAPAIK